MSSLTLVEIPRNCIVGQQRQQMSELQFDNFPNRQSFLVWKIRFENQVTTCSDFPSDAMVWIKEVDMVDSWGWIEILAIRFWKFSKFWDAGREDCFCSEQDHPESPNFKKKVSLQEQKAKKENRFLRGRQIAFMIYDNVRVTGAHHTVLDYADLFSVTLHDDNIQEFETRCDEVLLSMTAVPTHDISESLYTLRIREYAQLKTFLELYDMEVHQKISMPNYQKLKTMVMRSIVQKLRLRNFDAGQWRIESSDVVKSRKG